MMNNTFAFSAVVLLLFGCAQQPVGEVADTVFTNGRIYTVNEA